MIDGHTSTESAWGSTEAAESSTPADGRRLAGFFGLALGLTWLAWVPLAILRRPTLTAARTIPLLAGCFGPTAAALLILRAEPSQMRRSFWRRLVDPRPIRRPWGAVALLFLPLMQAAALEAARMTGRELPSFAEAVQIATNPVQLTTLAMSELLSGPLAEEPGWRGFAQPRMHARFGFVRGSLLLGMIWWAWHLPLFFIPGTVQSKIKPGTPEFVSFFARILSESVLLGWLYTRTDGSTLLAVLSHWTSNASSTLMAGGVHKQLDPTVEHANTLLKIIAAIVVGLRGPTTSVYPHPRAHAPT